MGGRLLKEKRVVVTGVAEAAAPPSAFDRWSSSQGRARGGTGRSVTVHVTESPLGWLKARRHVSGRQFDAGEQLRVDWERAQLAPSVTMRWDATPAGSGRLEATLDPTEAQVAARRRFDTAIAAVGPGLTDILWRVVCAGEGMRDAEQALGWPARAGKLVLCLALDRLADHYGMK